MKIVLAILVATAACYQGGGSPRAGDVRIVGAELRIAPVAATTAAGYWELRHLGTVPDTLLEVASDAGEISIHRSVVANGLRVMQPVTALEIPANQTTRFAPGGLHLMLEHFRGPVQIGDTMGITLRLARGGRVTVALPVRLVGDDD